jgi:hypothetical protein
MTLDRLTGFFLALLVSLGAPARAATDAVPPLPVRKPANVESHLPGDQPTIPWTEAEINAAKSECDRLLKDMAIEYEQLAPIKEGICGAPAPILVKSIGRDPKVAIDPPATITCPLAAGLYAWLKNKVEPDAKAMLGTEVVKLTNASSYVCRNRYGGADTPISEHALANALDVSTFVLASGDRLTVLDTWPRLVTDRQPPKPDVAEGTTGSLIKATHTTAPAAEASDDDTVRLTRVKANPFEAPFPPQEAKPPKSVSLPPPPATESIAAKIKSNPFVAPVPEAKLAAATPQSSPHASAPTLSAALPRDTTPGQTLAERRSAFIKDIHDEACGVFGTTLGPAANEAHKNHFHLDMKARRHAGLCD